MDKQMIVKVVVGMDTATPQSIHVVTDNNRERDMLCLMLRLYKHRQQREGIGTMEAVAEVMDMLSKCFQLPYTYILDYDSSDWDNVCPECYHDLAAHEGHVDPETGELVGPWASACVECGCDYFIRDNGGAL